jgi:predicted nucleic acid-binding Zn ribbon protein
MSENLGSQFDDFQQRRDREERRYFARRPKQIKNILAQVVQQRGYAQVRVAGERDAAWAQAAGEVTAAATRVGTLRRGTLEILVTNSLLMQELTFRKEALINQLQAALPDAGIKQIKFRVGQVH